MDSKSLDSSHLFLKAHNSFTRQTLVRPSPPPFSLFLLSNHSPLPHIPSNLPQSKLIPNTRFLVDAFRHAGDYSVSYFLSHFHSDHYAGLTPNWSRGIVFCSETTARLLVEVIGVSSVFVVPLPLRERVSIDGCQITLIDANHCTGAVQFLFKVHDGSGNCKRYVHSGDFRFCDSMKEEPFLSEFVGSEAIFLDSTYCNPKFVFPLQDESVDYIVEVIERIGGEYDGSCRDVLFLVATYVIGKEKILLEVARRCKRKIHVDGRKMAVLRVLGYGESGIFTDDDLQSDVHVVGWNVLGETWPYFRPNFVRMKEIMDEKGYSKVVGFVPTGWTYEVKRNKFTVKSKDSFQIHLVPYSEHSNFNELKEYVRFLKPKCVVPTVGLDVEEVDSKHANKMRKHFAGLVDEMANKQEFLRCFYRGSDEMVEKDSKADGNPSVQEHGSQDHDVSNNDEKEKIIQELGQCLPKWVTQSQMINLIKSSGWNVVEAVSHFYELETEFHGQVFSSQDSLPASQSPLIDDTTILPMPNLVTEKTHSTITFPNQNLKSPNLRHPVKIIVSPVKRKRYSENRSTKKVKANTKSETTSSKQSMITKFFAKALSHSPQAGNFESKLELVPDDKNFMPCDTEEIYKHELDQFIQVTGGNESSRVYAATILKETKGDINKALDLYYCNPEGNLGECTELEHATCDIEVPSGKKNVVEELGCVPDSSVQDFLAADIDVTHVSLPPEKYKPKEHACWRDGQPAPYIHLARTFDLLENEKGKIKATSMLCNMFRSLLALSPGDVLPALYLCTNKIAADHENMELNIGGSLVTAAIEDACGTTRSKIREMYNKLGDLGDVAQECRQTQRLLAPPSPLLIKDIFSALRKISMQTGSGSSLRKKGLIVNLLCSCRGKEIKFLVRTLVRNLRIGAMIRTVLPALAQAVVMNASPSFHQEETSEKLKEKLQCLSEAVVEAYNVLPSLGLVVPPLLKLGIGFCVSSLSMVPGIPIRPMLAKITNGVPQALEQFQNKAFTCEYKYDGQRAQIHKLVDGSIRVFSRNGDETTPKFPDLIDIIRGSSKPAAGTFIVDAEVVAVDRKSGCKLLSFQELSSRSRGSKDTLITLDRIKVDICVFVFDIMYANGEQLLGLPLRKRRDYLKDLFYEEKLGYFEYAKQISVEENEACLTCEATLTKINSFLEDAIESSCEGIMVKSLDVDAGYSPSKRTGTWLKVKRDYVEGLNDSLDLVPIGAWHGNGRKAGWYSPFLMACYNPESEEYQSVCRVMSGFSDAFYMQMKDFYSGDKILSKKPPYYRTAESPDVWFCPELVWEIRGADFTISPVHHAAIGLVHSSRGISIRFPRFLWSLSDRNPDECSTAADIAELFHSQTRKMNVMTER